jgi:hypothetical protein
MNGAISCSSTKWLDTFSIQADDPYHTDQWDYRWAKDAFTVSGAATISEWDPAWDPGRGDPYLYSLEQLAYFE